MPIALSLDRDKANEVVKQALEMMETVDEYADEGSHIIATQKASGLGAGNAAKLKIKFWPDGDSTRIEYETKKGNPLDLTTDTDEIEEEFQRSVQQVSNTPSEYTEQRKRRKEAESTSPTTVKDAVSEAAQKVNETVTDSSDDEKHQSESTDSAYCPNCGTEISATDKYCWDCGTELPNGESSGPSEEFQAQVNEELDEREIDTDPDKSFRERVEEIRKNRQQEKVAKQQEAAKEIPALDCEPIGRYVNAARYEKVKSILDQDESVHYITRGSTIDVQGSSAGESLFGKDRDRKSGTKGWVRAVFTDKRVAIKIPQFLGTDERSVPYSSITSVDLDTGLLNKRISLQTMGQTYHIEATEPGKDEVKEIMRFVRKKISDTQKPDTIIKESEQEDPLDKIDKLQNLHEQGVISTEEFEEKKQDLLDQV